MRLVLAVVLALPLLAADCPQCTAQKACDAHVASDKAAAEALRDGLKWKEPGARQKAVEAFAEATGAHANCRPAANAQSMAAALRDPHASVYATAAELLGTTQDGRAAAGILSKELDAILKRTAKAPKSDAEKIAWNDDLTRLEGIAKGLEGCGVPEAGPPMAKMLGSAELQVLKLVGNRCKDVRGREVPPAILDAIERCRKMPQSSLRDSIVMAFVNSWEQMTASGIKSPITEKRDPKDMDVWITEAKSWWSKNGKSWK